MNRVNPKIVQKIYSARASYYDHLHHAVTLWSDSKWRKKASDAIPENAKRILDLCTGTGETIVELNNCFKNKYITGIDFTHKMLQQAVSKLPISEFVNFVEGDVTMLPFHNNSFDAVLSVCGLGGVNRPEWVIHEAHRVLKPEGIFFAIEMCTPHSSIMRKMWHKLAIEPWVKRFWGFRDIEIEKLIKDSKFKNYQCDYRMERKLGSICEITAIA